jgi:hypothetical protein
MRPLSMTSVLAFFCVRRRVSSRPDSTLRVAGHALLGGGITPLGHSCTSAVGLQLCDSTARMKSNLPFAAARQNP